MLPDDPPRPREADDFPKRGPNSLASIGERAVARAIDILVELVPFTLAVLPFLRIDGQEVKVDSVPIWLSLVAIGIAVVYETAMVAWRGQTLGKMLLGLRVARLVNGTKPDGTQAAMRALVPGAALSIPVVSLGLYLFVFLAAVPNVLRQGIHDRAAATVVVRTR